MPPMTYTFPPASATATSCRAMFSGASGTQTARAIDASRRRRVLLLAAYGGDIGCCVVVIADAYNFGATKGVEPHDFAVKGPAGCAGNPFADENRGDVIAAHDVPHEVGLVVLHRLAELLLKLSDAVE